MYSRDQAAFSHSRHNVFSSHHGARQGQPTLQRLTRSWLREAACEIRIRCAMIMLDLGWHVKRKQAWILLRLGRTFRSYPLEV